MLIHTQAWSIDSKNKINRTTTGVFQLINPEVKIISVENTPDDPRQRKPDITKAKELLGWEPKIKLRDGLPLMEDDFRKRLGIERKVWAPLFSKLAGDRTEFLREARIRILCAACHCFQFSFSYSTYIAMWNKAYGCFIIS